MNANRDSLPIIALVPGDCTGIGPEQTARVLSDDRLAGVARLVVVGDARVLEMGMAHAGVKLEVERVASPAKASFREGVVPLVDLGNTDPKLFPIGKSNAESGRLTGETLSRAIDFARADEVDAITFAPLNKRAMFDGGWKFPDEHKMFASLLGHKAYFSEMNVLDGQWMSRVTGHQSLREALDGINPESITDAIELADRMMKKSGIASPRIAVAALNPHAGEGGLFGRDEIEMIRPTVEAAGQARHRLQRSVSCGHGLHPCFRRRVRQRSRDVSRPGPDRDQAARLQPRGHGHGGARHGLHDAVAWHRLRYCRPRRRKDRRARKRGAACRATR